MSEKLSALTDAARKVEEAQAAFAEAASAESAARSRCTQAKNNLNAAQKLFDAEVKKLKEAAPLDSDWGASQRRKLEVAA